MNSAEQLKQLLKNAFDRGFTTEDIQGIMEDIESEHEAAVEREEEIDELQNAAAEALVDFLFEISYIDEDADYDEQFDAIYEALQMVRDGKLKMAIKSKCDCSESSKDNDKSSNFNTCSFKIFSEDPNFKDNLKDFDDKLQKLLQKYL